MEYAWNNDLTNGTFNSTPSDDCYGIAWDIGLVNSVVLDLTAIDEGTYTLDQWNGPTFAAGCIGESIDVTAPSTTVTAAPSGQATSAPTQTYPDCSTFSCPDNNDGYCLSNGETFQLGCGIWYGTDQEANLCAATLGDCVNACTSTYADSCVMVDFDENNAGDCGSSEDPLWGMMLDQINCFINTNTNNPGDGGSGLMSLVKVSDPAKRAVLPRSTSATTSASATASVPSATASFSPITVTDATGNLVVNPHVNGSLFISAANNTTPLTDLTDGITFVADVSESAVMGDSIGRLLYYFPDTIAAVGASRLRLGAWGSIPKTAELVMLLPWVSASNQTILVAIDSSFNVFYPFVCGIEGQLNKLFLVSNATTGSDVLVDPDLTYTVVGGVAQQCLSLAMVAEGLSGFSANTSNSTASS